MGHVKTKPWWIAARIVGSWVLAVVILVGGLYAVQSHGGLLGSAPIAGGGSGYWVKVTNIDDTSGSEYVNLAATSSIIRGHSGDQEATLIWSGGGVSSVKEMPEEILKLPQIKTK